MVTLFYGNPEGVEPPAKVQVRKAPKPPPEVDQFRGRLAELLAAD
jgi:hypothetical protein